MGAILAAIRSPSTGVYHVGPLTIHMYGVMLLLGIAAAVWLTGKRWVKFGGEWDLVYRVAIWGVIAGIIGARLYHDITSWNQDQAIHDHWWGPFAVWQGGLGVWGGIGLGVLVGAWVVKRSGNSVTLFMDAVAPGLLLAQAIGRWGNWWNQELYGKHTTLPWALEIHGKGAANLYHPTFLYESIWDVLGVLLLLWVDRRFTIRRPGLFALYVSYYTFGRMFEGCCAPTAEPHSAAAELLGRARVLSLLSFFVYWQFLRIREAEVSPVPAREGRADEEAGAEDGRAKAASGRRLRSLRDRP
jgi:prolipoprotein diacylglyceryl transferase